MAIDYHDQSLTLVKGDSKELLIVVTEADTASTDTPLPRLPINLWEAVDGTVDRHAIIRFAAKRKESDGDNDDALLFKDSQKGPSDINILNQGTNESQAELLQDVADTNTSEEPVIDRGDDALHSYDVEVNRQDVERAGASGVGTVSVTNGSNIVTGTGSLFSNAKCEDILNLLDAGNLHRPTLITKVVSDTEIEVGRTIWTDALTSTYEVRRNRRRTAASGDLFFLRERVSKL